MGELLCCSGFMLLRSSSWPPTAFSSISSAGPSCSFGRAASGGVLLFLTLTGSSGMVIWIGDPNLLYTLPVYFLLFLLCTKGDIVGRLAVCIIFFCLEMSVCALLDSYLQLLSGDDLYRWYDVATRLARPAVFGTLWLLLRRRFPAQQVRLSRRLWKLVLALAAMPLCALIAVVLLTFQKYESDAVSALALNQGLAVLPLCTGDIHRAALRRPDPGGSRAAGAE